MMNIGPAFGAAIIPILITITFYAFIIYVLVSFLKFMRQKNQHDRDRNEKLDRLIHYLENQDKNRKIDRALEQIEKQQNEK
ncbi:hypothetical protein [Brevibacillus centrosporus]|uniref:hypothetical protein n=1 Tax=Brevibacillus centrosporus TaxID=54910 RepID=UPI0037FFB144